MAEVIDTAGKELKPASLRREAIQVIRALMRKPDVSDQEYEDALESLVELAKTE